MIINCIINIVNNIVNIYVWFLERLGKKQFCIIDFVFQILKKVLYGLGYLYLICL